MRGYLLIIAANPSSPPIPAPAAAPGDIPEEVLVGTGCSEIGSVVADWFPLVKAGFGGVGIGVCDVSVGVVDDGEVVGGGVDDGVDDGVVVDDDVEGKGPFATIFMKATAIQTLT